MNYYLGIDPGAKGAFACLIESDVFMVYMMNKAGFLTLADYLWQTKAHVVCCIEKVHAMPKQGSVSMFTFGEGYGWLKGVLDGYSIPYQEIPPQTWKKEFGLNSNKTKSVEVAHQLFPHVNLVPDGCKKPSDGMAEALLLALYAKRRL